jgi:PilZ domain
MPLRRENAAAPAPPPSGAEQMLAVVAAPVERRTRLRVAVDLPVAVWSLAQPTRRLEGRALDLSAGGAQLAVEELAPYVATLQLLIGLRSGLIGVTASVCWRRPPVLGVRFEQIGPADLVRLFEFLRAP